MIDRLAALLECDSRQELYAELGKASVEVLSLFAACCAVSVLALALPTL